MTNEYLAVRMNEGNLVEYLDELKGSYAVYYVLNALISNDNLDSANQVFRSSKK